MLKVEEHVSVGGDEVGKVNVLNSSFECSHSVPTSTVVKGGESHKSIDLSGNKILRIYYNSRVSCICLELLSRFFLLCVSSLPLP